MPSAIPKLMTEIDERAMMYKALSGDLVFTVTPATVSRATTAQSWSRTVTIKLTDMDGNVHGWFDRTITSGCSIADTSSAGTATIPSTTLTFVGGVATVVVSGNAATWGNGETDTLTIAQATILGYTVASKTSVETFATP